MYNVVFVRLKKRNYIYKAFRCFVGLYGSSAAVLSELHQGPLIVQLMHCSSLCVDSARKNEFKRLLGAIETATQKKAEGSLKTSN